MGLGARPTHTTQGWAVWVSLGPSYKVLTLNDERTQRPTNDWPPNPKSTRTAATGTPETRSKQETRHTPDSPLIRSGMQKIEETKIITSFYLTIPLELKDTSTNHYFKLARPSHINTSLFGSSSLNFSKLINGLGINSLDHTSFLLRIGATGQLQ
ncbi:hypothetical protein PGTUg99_013674 [Puccinia graminis f. sp. tritici]|uniref:Uncharacterized protein n=1 Tax=Puccinia graminis f. sp. tritici TaxID=56615 RepID=A0A5B0M5V1_PUCGR|nr:hypothetical protein PGTUg99_013674 [Puccinia graminis f. sp. tritici]